MSYKNSSSAVICSKDKILLFLRDDIPTIPYPNHWQLPGGGAEDGETPEQCLRRELDEEVSYVPKDLHLLTEFKRPDGKTSHIYWTFVGDAEAAKFKIGPDEGQKIAFYNLEEMEKLQLTPIITRCLAAHKQALQKALAQKSFKDFSF